MEFVSNPANNEGPTVLAATLTATCVALLTVGARLYVPLGMIHSFGLDDGFMTLAMAIAIAGEVVLVSQVRHGVGRHTGDVDLAVDYPIAMKMFFVSQPLFLSALCLVKLAVGSSLLRIASKKLYKTMIIGIMVFMTAYTIACIFTIVFQCTDVRIFWDLDVDSTCWDIETIKGLAYANSSVNILTDLLFGIAIPAPMLWTLNVPNRDFLGSIYGKGSKAPTGNAYYGRGTLRSGNSNWQTLSNSQWPVGTGEGDRAPRPRKDRTGNVYEMGTYASRPVRPTTVMAGEGTDNSDESLYNTGLRDGPERHGIKKTTVTTIIFSKNQKDAPEQ
ncbi:integral membrane family protein [Colletotrichum kahawae]|uniref:Integral membrane family protein n=1 Tax=Colletotrichum kahawae TaxID=34407 RepID=A0AAD9YDG4_COLKA|nr:integral membrane family protein [Colletotrichum kahawae]